MARLGILPISVLLSSFCVGIGVAENWDPAAITVFPDHADFAAGLLPIETLVADGETLFQVKFNALDGAGRPGATGAGDPTGRREQPAQEFLRVSGPDASACSSCHNVPRAGGSGDFVTNVFAGANLQDPPVEAVDPRTTNERNTTGLFGAGQVELLAREMTLALFDLRDTARAQAKQRGTPVTVALVASGVSFGHLTALPDGRLETSDVQGVDPDLIIRPFTSKGVVISLREFTINALNQHHGIQATERYGKSKTGLSDFDRDGVDDEFSVGQVSAMVAFQATLPAPRQKFSEDPFLRAQEERGQTLFTQVGCSTCHVPAHEITTTTFAEPSPFNEYGTLRGDGQVATLTLPIEGFQGTVTAYTDLKRHNLCDAEIRHFCNEQLVQGGVPVDYFLTAKLWDLATSGPYGHRGDLPTISQAILAHGGEARAEREAFLALDDTAKRELIAFLRTLGRAEVP